MFTIYILKEIQVSLLERMSICVNSAFEVNSDNFAGFTVKLFRETLELVLRSSFFLFNDKLYLQTDGLCMGLPLAPTIAIFPNFNVTLGSTSIDKFSGNFILDSKPSILK